MNVMLNGLTGVGLDFVPGQIEMTYEIGVLADLQVGEAGVKNDNLSLTWGQFNSGIAYFQYLLLVKCSHPLLTVGTIAVSNPISQLVTT